MIGEAHVQVWLATAPVDMRRSFDGLAEHVRTFLGHDPLSGSIDLAHRFRVCLVCELLIANNHFVGKSAWPDRLGILGYTLNAVRRNGHKSGVFGGVGLLAIELADGARQIGIDWQSAGGWSIMLGSCQYWT